MCAEKRLFPAALWMIPPQRTSLRFPGLHGEDDLAEVVALVHHLMRSHDIR